MKIANFFCFFFTMYTMFTIEIKDGRLKILVFIYGTSEIFQLEEKTSGRNR